MNAQKEGAWVYGLEFYLQLQSNRNKVKFIFLILKDDHPSIQTNEHQECSSSWLMVISSDS